MAGEAKWPLTREQQELLVMLASMIRRFGAERFLEAKLVRADKKDFPDKWEGTLQSVHQVLYRLCWHAYIDPEIVVEDRRSRIEDNQLLRTSEMALLSCERNVATFQVAAIGNDDVAGLLAHEIGEVFLELSPTGASDGPFRSGTREPDAREASVAAVFLGLGVPAANAARYRRHAAEVRGRNEYSENKVGTAGGLELVDITMLLAIQDILRDEVQGALSTLLAPQRDLLDEWKDVLDPHEDELRELLGLDDAREPRPLARPDQPRVAPAHDETAHKRVNVGHEVMRVRQRSYLGTWVGAALGALPFLVTLSFGDLGIVLGWITLIIGVVVGYAYFSRPFYRCTDGGCSALMSETAPTCPRCGGTVTKTITPKELEAFWKKWREEEDERDAQLDPSEFAGDPDADVLRSERERAPRARNRHARG